MIHEITNYFTQSIHSYFDTIDSTMNATSIMNLSHFTDGIDVTDYNIDNKSALKNNHNISINSNNNYMNDKSPVNVNSNTIKEQKNYFNLSEEDLEEDTIFTFISDDESDSNVSPNVFQKPLLYANEPFDEQEGRAAVIKQLYRDAHNNFETYSELQSLLGLHIRIGDYDSMLLQESRLLSLCDLATKSNTIDSSEIEPFCKPAFEKYLLGRKCVNTWIKCNKQLSSYGIPLSSLHGAKNKDPFTMFANYNTIRGFRNRLYWNEKEKEYNTFGMIKRRMTALPFDM
jgi:hypothetical protein